MEIGKEPAIKLTRREKEQETRRQYILDAATEIFGKEGYENASMNQIAQKAEFTKRTVYQYFDDKADLYLSVILQLYRKMCKELLPEEGFKREEGINGMELIRRVLNSQYSYMKSHQDTFKIMYDIGKVRQMTRNPKVAEFLAMDNRITEVLAEVIDLGQKDGSISKKSSAKETAEYMKFLTTAVFDKLAITGAYYAAYVEKSPEELTRGLLSLILDMLKPEIT